jgi:hypothetical protein
MMPPSSASLATLTSKLRNQRMAPTTRIPSRKEIPIAGNNRRSPLKPGRSAIEVKALKLVTRGKLVEFQAVHHKPFRKLSIASGDKLSNGKSDGNIVYWLIVGSVLRTTMNIIICQPFSGIFLSCP